MNFFLRWLKIVGLLFLFWILVFDFQRLLFSIHNWSIISSYPFTEWLQIFVRSLRLDLAMAAYLCVLPFTFILLFFITRKKIFFTLFKYILLLEVVLVALIQSGEINAYPEWKHKLTTGVFIHFMNVDEMFRTADFGMTFWFFVYVILQIVFAWRLFRWFFYSYRNVQPKYPLLFLPTGLLSLAFYFMVMRGGLQQIPINIDTAYFSKHYPINDLSVNSTYFFGKSWLLFNRSDIGKYLSNYTSEELSTILHDFNAYTVSSSLQLLENKRPNLVFFVLEGWSASACSSITGKPGVTPVLDSLAKEGVLFTNIYSSGTTSEIGNTTIFSGYPALPEISMTMQPYKNRELKSINQLLKNVGYSSFYMFGGDLKYGNIESYLMLHDFDKLYDENDFPPNLSRGKLNYYDEDLMDFFLEKINQEKKPFMACAFTGSTHSPFDSPAPKKFHYSGEGYPEYMNSMLYANECIAKFMQTARKEPWYDNTLFVFVADHGHGTPVVSNPNDSRFFHIPFLLYGEPLKDSVKGTKITTLGSQADIAQTLLQQMRIDTKQYFPWSKDLLCNNVPQFALNATSRGFGWITPKGHFTYHFDYQKYIVNTYSKMELKHQRKRCNAFMQRLFDQYLKLGSQ